jgi:hypothetical protein
MTGVQAYERRRDLGVCNRRLLETTGSISRVCLPLATSTERPFSDRHSRLDLFHRVTFARTAAQCGLRSAPGTPKTRASSSPQA